MEATVEAPSAQTRKDYTSRPGALSRFFRMSRDGWKSKYKDLKATVKGYKNRLAHLTRSREQWRIRAERAGDRRSRGIRDHRSCGPDWRRGGSTTTRILTEIHAVGPIPDEGFRESTHPACTFWGRASGVSDPAQILFEQPESSRRRAAGRYAHARRAFNSSSLMALVNRRRQLGAICSNGATCTRASSRPLR